MALSPADATLGKKKNLIMILLTSGAGPGHFKGGGGRTIVATMLQILH